MAALERIYLPMSNRDAGYCVTNIEQRQLARKFGLGTDVVRAHLLRMIDTINPQKTANKTKAIIEFELGKLSNQSGRDSTIAMSSIAA